MLFFIKLIKTSLFLMIFLDSLIPKTEIYASDFFIDVRVEHAINKDAVTTVNNSITIENATSKKQASEYRLRLSNIEPEDLKVFDQDRDLKHELIKEDDTFVVKVIFEDPVAGIGQKRQFYIEFKEKNFAVKTNEVWEISLPRLTHDNGFRLYDVYISVPLDFGSVAYISPEAKEVEEFDDKRVFHFTKEQVKRSGIVAGFGNFQVFSFIINYHLENTSKNVSGIEIALPPDTSTQRVYYTSIVPEPDNVYIDNDGNWMAVYNLNPGQRVDVAAYGSVQLFPDTKRPYSQKPAVFLKNTAPTSYWQSDDPEIQKLAKTHNTPEKIYDFLTSNLTYNYDRVRPNAERLGAKAALQRKDDALCMEFTDLFIAMARAAGIPARGINGFAYTENPTIQPLSLVADVLHSWPEYWNNDKNSWIPIDPTWGTTTGGVDYFNKLDLRHFAFVIHGENDSYPIPPGSYKLGPNPQKDIFVTFGQMPADLAEDISIGHIQERSFLFSKDRYKITIMNRSAMAYYDLNTEILFDGIKKSEFTVDVLPPFGKHEEIIEVTYGLFNASSPTKISVAANGFSTTFLTQKSRVVTIQLIIFFIVIIAVLFLFLFYGKLKSAKILIDARNRLFKGPENN
jgi:transglutaminase-like putative cysteine protease